MSMSKGMGIASVGVIAVMFFAAPTFAQADRPILQMESLQARFDGERCGPSVRVLITGPDRSFFTGAAAKVEALSRGVRQVVNSTCPAMGRLVVKGRVANSDRVIYNAMLEKANNWRPSFAAATSSQAFLADADSGAAISGPTPRSEFKAAPGFMASAAVVALARGKYLCADADQAGVCGGTTQYNSMSAAGGVQVSRFVADNTGGEAVVTNRVEVSDGFFCVDPATAEIKVEGGVYTTEGRVEMEEQLGERVRGAGVLCTGYSERGGKVLAQTFYQSGRAATAQPNVITATAAQPKVRLRD